MSLSEKSVVFVLCPQKQHAVALKCEADPIPKAWWCCNFSFCCSSTRDFVNLNMYQNSLLPVAKLNPCTLYLLLTGPCSAQMALKMQLHAQHFEAVPGCHCESHQTSQKFEISPHFSNCVKVAKRFKDPFR